jgi:diguanylate cyclase (GGDEF)-like protein
MNQDDEITAPGRPVRRQWIENLSIVTLTVTLFFAANYFDLHQSLRRLFGGLDTSVALKMRSLESGVQAELSDAAVSIRDGGSLGVDAIMSLGLVGSLGLAAFAFLQYGRLRTALRSQSEAERLSRRLAMLDQLTGLANRRNFEEFGQRVFFERPVSERRAVFLVDLDHFKSVNDVYGHAAGDKVLVEYARRIQGHFPGGIVARFGGDEFAMITPPLKEDGEALHYARFCLAGVSEAFKYNAASLHLGASVGVAMVGDDDDTVAEALRRADIALYKAKRAGRQQIAFFEDTLEKVVRERSWIESELRVALREGGIVPYFQPMVDLATREVLGYGRWRAGTIRSADRSARWNSFRSPRNAA